MDLIEKLRQRAEALKQKNSNGEIKLASEKQINLLNDLTGVDFTNEEVPLTRSKAWSMISAIMNDKISEKEKIEIIKRQASLISSLKVIILEQKYVIKEYEEYLLKQVGEKDE